MSPALAAAAAAMLVIPASMAIAAPAAAAPTRSPYTNCAQLNAMYPNGVGRAGARDLSGGRPASSPVRNFRVDSRLYASLPKTLDRDRDGIACERLTTSTTPRPAPAVPRPAPPRPAPAAGSRAARTLVTPAGFGFVTPSGNIRCLASTDDVRCDITSVSYRIPARPRSCPLDYGRSFALHRSASLLCAGDTLMGTAAPAANPWYRKTGVRPLTTLGMAEVVLPYGWRLNSGRISCTSTPTGVTCTHTTTRHGFSVAKNGYRLF